MHLALSLSVALQNRLNFPDPIPTVPGGQVFVHAPTYKYLEFLHFVQADAEGLQNRQLFSCSIHTPGGGDGVEMALILQIRLYVPIPTSSYFVGGQLSTHTPFKRYFLFMHLVHCEKSSLQNRQLFTFSLQEE